MPIGSLLANTLHHDCIQLCQNGHCARCVQVRNCAGPTAWTHKTRRPTKYDLGGLDQATLLIKSSSARVVLDTLPGRQMLRHSHYCLYLQARQSCVSTLRVPGVRNLPEGSAAIEQPAKQIRATVDSVSTLSGASGSNSSKLFYV